MPVTGKIAALKLLRPHPSLLSLMGKKTLERQFTAEAVTMAGLRHPNILEIWDFDRADGHPFYVMAYHSNNLGIHIGETYRTEMPSRRLPVDLAVQYALAILSGLECLHDSGIVHRDIKPFNILLTDQNTVKICDFGLSLLRGERFAGPANLKVGSPYYTAPEQEEDPDEVTAAADLYSVGVVLYRMLTGNLPEGNAPGLGTAALDAEWGRFIRRALADRPEGRFRGAAEMSAELKGLSDRWRRRMEAVCRIEPSIVRQSEVRPLKCRLRSDPVKVGPRQGRRAFKLNPLWRPHRYVRNDFVARQSGLVYDRTTGLLWQKSGVAYPHDWDQSHRYIDRLNRERTGGRADWRLPTTDELMSLLTPTPQGRELCIAPVFDPLQKSLWSCDRSSFIAAWYASLDLGFIYWQDFTAGLYTKGVCGPRSE
jgi:serine/threonine-protein kinase